MMEYDDWLEWMREKSEAVEDSDQANVEAYDIINDR